jgi:hypothetical protein
MPSFSGNRPRSIDSSHKPSRRTLLSLNCFCEWLKGDTDLVLAAEVGREDDPAGQAVGGHGDFFRAEADLAGGTGSEFRPSLQLDEKT